MPLSSGIFAGAEHLFARSSSCAAWKRIEISSSFAMHKSFPRLPILHNEYIVVKFEENIVVRGNTMNRCKIFYA
jgi:hypothetical protein